MWAYVGRTYVAKNPFPKSCEVWACANCFL